jgi:hypothetical protein
MSDPPLKAFFDELGPVDPWCSQFGDRVSKLLPSSVMAYCVRDPHHRPKMYCIVGGENGHPARFLGIEVRPGDDERRVANRILIQL